jgi:hypothetical protein
VVPAKEIKMLIVETDENLICDYFMIVNKHIYMS